jgi:hypothetical protein
MATEWFYSHDGDRRGPVSEAEIKALAADGRLHADDLVWRAGMEAWMAAAQVPGLLPPGSPPPIPRRAAAYEPTPAQSDAQGKKIAAAICASWSGRSASTSSSSATPPPG